VNSCVSLCVSKLAVEVLPKGFEVLILLDSLHTRSMRASCGLLQFPNGDAVEIFVSVSCGIYAMWLFLTKVTLESLYKYELSC